MYWQIKSCTDKEVGELIVDGVMKLRKWFNVNITTIAEIVFHFDAV